MAQNTESVPFDWYTTLGQDKYRLVFPLEKDNLENFKKAFTEFETKYKLHPDAYQMAGSFSHNHKMPLLYHALGLYSTHRSGYRSDEYYKPRIAQFLFNKGARIDIPITIETHLDVPTIGNFDNADALIGAVLFVQPKSVDWLLRHGANPTHKTSEGKTAFEYAVQNYNWYIDPQNKVKPGHMLPRILEIVSLFLKNSEVKAQMGPEFNRVKAIMKIPFDDALQQALEIQKLTLDKNRFGRQGRFVSKYNLNNYGYYARKANEVTGMKRLHKIANSPTIGSTIGHKNVRKLGILKNLINLPREQYQNVIGSFLGPRPVSGFRVKPQPKGPGAAPIVTPADPEQPMRYNVALALQHPNTFPLPNKLPGTRKRKTRRNRSRRSRK